MRLGRVLLVLGAAIAGAFGLAYAFWPNAMARVVEISLPTASARADFRATYAGAQIGMAIFFALAARRADWIRPGLVALALIVGGFGLVRLGSLAIDGAPMSGAPAGVLWLVGAGELLSGLVCVWALRRLARSSG